MKMLAANGNVNCKPGVQEHRKRTRKDCCFWISYFMIYIHMHSQQTQTFQYDFCHLWQPLRKRLWGERPSGLCSFHHVTEVKLGGAG